MVRVPRFARRGGAHRPAGLIGTGGGTLMTPILALFSGSHPPTAVAVDGG